MPGTSQSEFIGLREGKYPLHFPLHHPLGDLGDSSGFGVQPTVGHEVRVVGPNGLEPLTSTVSICGAPRHAELPNPTKFTAFKQIVALS